MEDFMRELRTVYVLSCALLLGDGLSHAVLASAEETTTNPCENRGGQSILGAEQEPGNAGYTIRGEVLCVEGNTYVVRKQDGKEVNLQAQSAPSSILLMADSSSTSQNAQQKVPSGAREAGSSNKMQLDRDGSGITDPHSNKFGGQSSQREDIDTPKTPGSRLTERSSNATGDAETSYNPCEKRGGQGVLGAQQEPGNTGYTIRGEVLRVEGNTFVVRRQDGNEVSLKTDRTDIAQGDFIQANLNGQNQVLWIGPLKSTDRRNEHEPDCR